MDQGERQSFIVKIILLKKEKKKWSTSFFSFHSALIIHDIMILKPLRNHSHLYSFTFDRFPARFRNVSVQFSRPVTYFFTARKPSVESWEVFLGVKSANGKVSPRGIGGELRNRANFRGMPIVLHSVTRWKRRKCGGGLTVTPNKRSTSYYSLFVNLYKVDNINLYFEKLYKILVGNNWRSKIWKCSVEDSVWMSRLIEIAECLLFVTNLRGEFRILVSCLVSSINHLLWYACGILLV